MLIGVLKYTVSWNAPEDGEWCYVTTDSYNSAKKVFDALGSVGAFAVQFYNNHEGKTVDFNPWNEKG